MNDNATATFIAFAVMLACFIGGGWVMGAYWQAEVIRQGKAHYVVDPQSGETKLVWNGGEK